MVTARNWCFTLNNPTPEEVLTLEAIREQPWFRYYVYQTEQGENGTPHIQGYVQVKKLVSMKFIKDAISNRVHVEVARGSVEKNKNYCTKLEGRLTEPVEFGEPSKGKGTRCDIEEFINDAEQCDLSEEDLLRKHGNIVAKYPRFVQRVERFFTQRKPPGLFHPRPGWQAELAEYLRWDPDPRKIRWYYDPIGNSGKSYFGRKYYIEADSGGDSEGRRYERPFLVTYGKWQDIFYAYKKEKIVIFDWPRDIQESFPYAVLEMFKNGYFLNTKYESYPVYFDVPHVIVFANFEPNQMKLSADRWEIKFI